jgi:hypothetical protein
MPKKSSHLFKIIRQCFRHPSRLLKIFDPRARRRFWNFLKARMFLAKMPNAWSDSLGKEAFQRREYNCYEEYVAHQRLKGSYINLGEYDNRFRTALAERVGAMDAVAPGSVVLCLAARIGSEVKAFHDAGCFAVGIDLNPGDNNRYVLTGDFHDLQFPQDSVDVVYTNSLDHAFDIQRIIGEVQRVLKPGGHFIVEAVEGTDAGVMPQAFESFSWKAIDDLKSLFETAGLSLVDQQKFAEPWSGVQLLLQHAPVIVNCEEDLQQAALTQVSGVPKAGELTA